MSENSHGRDPKGSGSHLTGEANELSSSLRDINPSRKTAQHWGVNVMRIHVPCHRERDILDSLYEAWDKLPVCSLLGVVGGAIQEIQALRDLAAPQGIEARSAEGGDNA